MKRVITKLWTRQAGVWLLILFAMVCPQTVWANDPIHYDAGYLYCGQHFGDENGDQYTDIILKTMRIWNYQGNNSHFYTDPKVVVTVDGVGAHTFYLDSLYTISYPGEGDEDPFKKGIYGTNDGIGFSHSKTYDKTQNGIRVKAFFENHYPEQTVTGNNNGGGSEKWCTADLHIRLYHLRKTTIHITGKWRDWSGGVNDNNEDVDWTFHTGYNYCNSISVARSQNGTGDGATITWTSNAPDGDGYFDIWCDTQYITYVPSSDTTTTYSYTFDEYSLCGSTHTWTVNYRPKGSSIGGTPWTYLGLECTSPEVYLAHNFIDYSYNNDATGTKNGTCTGHCQYCGNRDTKEDSEHPKLTYSVHSQNETYGAVSGALTVDGKYYIVSATPKNKYSFSRWSNNNTDNPQTYYMHENTSLTAYFATCLTLDVNDSAMGTTSGAGNHECEKEITDVKAIPNPGYRFVQWSDGSTDATHAPFTLTAPMTLTATFEPLTEVMIDSEIQEEALVDIRENPFNLTYAYSAPEGATEIASLNSDGSIRLYDTGDNNYVAAPVAPGTTILAPPESHYMFKAHYGLNTLILENFNTRNVTDMYQMFQVCWNFSQLTIRDFQMSQVGSCNQMFDNCTSLNTLTLEALPYLTDGTFNTQFSGEGKTVKYVLDDKSTVYIPTPERPNHLPTATERPTYTRTIAASSNWGTVVLPFETKSDDEVQLYRMTGFSDSILTVTPVAVVAANTPCIFKKKIANATSVTFTANSIVTPTPATPLTTAAVNGITIKGTYEQLTNQTGIYFVAQDLFWKADAGVTVAPYRAWFEYSGTSAPARFSIVEAQNPTGLTPSDSPCLGGESESVKAVKVIIDGRMYILRGEKMYDVKGTPIPDPFPKRGKGE